MSGRQDLNLRPSEPHSDALANCATPRTRKIGSGLFSVPVKTIAETAVTGKWAPRPATIAGRRTAGWAFLFAVVAVWRRGARGLSKSLTSTFPSAMEVSLGPDHARFIPARRIPRGCPGQFSKKIARPKAGQRGAEEGRTPDLCIANRPTPNRFFSLKPKLHESLSE